MKFSMKIFEEYTGLDKMISFVRSKNGCVDVGVFDKDKKRTGDIDQTNANIALKHEYGYGVPRRPVFNLVKIQKKKQIEKTMRSLMDLMIHGKITEEESLKIVGEEYQAYIKETYVAIKQPPNAPSTIAAKGGKANPLIDTGQLKNSVGYRIRNK